jgi:hypothetical protein
MTNVFDIDGVIFMGWDKDGVYPGPKDIIITGRSNQEMPETLQMLREKGIHNMVYFNPLPFDQKTRKSSGEHKAKIINYLLSMNENIKIAFEDDPIQADIIKEKCPIVNVVLLVHDLVEKENARHVKP